MYLSEEQITGLGTALNEASLLGLEVDPARKIAGATFAVLTLPEAGDAPEDPRVQILFQPVGRVVASLRNGRWNDRSASVEKFRISDLLTVVQSFHGTPIYGWEFFDVENKNNFDRWSRRLSLDFHDENWFNRRRLDFRREKAGFSHTVDLFQEGQERHLDIRLWFDDLSIRDPQGTEIPLDTFIAGGQRWWQGLSNQDERTQGSGIFPLKNKG